MRSCCLSPASSTMGGSEAPITFLTAPQADFFPPGLHNGKLGKRLEIRVPTKTSALASVDRTLKMGA